MYNCMVGFHEKTNGSFMSTKKKLVRGSGGACVGMAPRPPAIELVRVETEGAVEVRGPPVLAWHPDNAS